MDAYDFMYLDSPDKVQEWLEDNPKNYNQEDAFKLLRSKFNKQNKDAYLRNHIIQNPDCGKILMLRKPEMELVAIAAYNEQKNQGDNYMELLYYCTLVSGRGLGIRFMQQIISWAQTKKFYSEIITWADINAVGFFLKNEYVLIDIKKFEKDKEMKTQEVDYAFPMHKRLFKFDEKRLDKLNIIPFEDYEPKTEAARKVKQFITMLRQDPKFSQDLKEAREKAYENMKDINHGEASESDQYITNAKVYKKLFNFSGFSRSEMNDATPFKINWEMWKSWNAVYERLRKQLWWLNHPWGKNQEFMPWAYEQFIYYGASFFVLINDYGYNLAFNRQWILPLYDLIDDLPEPQDVNKVNFGKLDIQKHKKMKREIKYNFKVEEAKKRISILEKQDFKIEDSNPFKCYPSQVHMIPLLQPQLIDYIFEVREYRKQLRKMKRSKRFKGKILQTNIIPNPILKLSNRKRRRDDLKDELLRQKYFRKPRFHRRNSGRSLNNTEHLKIIQEKADDWIQDQIIKVRKWKQQHESFHSQFSS